MGGVGIPHSLQDAVIAVVTLGWLAFLWALVTRVRRGGATRRRDLRSWGGMGLQAAGIGAVFSDIESWGGATPATILKAGAALLLAGAGAALMVAAVRTLGKQWSVTARVREDHELVTGGPYAIVRHPIYTGLLALLLATGLARVDLAATALGAAIYVTGTLLRTRREEALLRETFGSAYEAYARRVPALVPRLGVRETATGPGA